MYPREGTQYTFMGGKEEGAGIDEGGPGRTVGRAVEDKVSNVFSHQSTHGTRSIEGVRIGSKTLLFAEEGEGVEAEQTLDHVAQGMVTFEGQLSWGWATA